jgi:DNA helicase-2/ATP-dependent DNA helicase PcrA
MSLKINYQQELNPAQYKAATSVDGPYLVIAGAGSGKTRVLIYRTAYLIEQGVNPEEVLLLTFTRRAAQEMLKRASMILDARCEHVTGGTFHSFANALLRRYGEYVGLDSRFIIMDQSDAQSALQSLRIRLGMDKLDRRFPKKEALMSILSSSVNRDEDFESVLCKDYPHFLAWLPEIRRIAEEYTGYKRQQSLLDFDDLLVLLKQLLSDNPTLRQKLSLSYPYIMVDEYQDTNKIQAEIVQMLASSHQNIMVVGDDAQSIYSFRGAHYKNIILFPQMFPETRVILLEQNYRSSQPILDLTNQLIQAAPEKYEKQLFSDRPGAGLPVYVDVPNENSQSKFVVNQITRLHEEGVPYKEIAVLFRSGWHSNDLEVELTRWGVPFMKYGGQKFVESAHIKDVISFLRILSQPYHDLSWMWVLGLLRGVGPQTARRITQEIVAQKQGFQADLSRLKPKDSVLKLMDLFKKSDPQQQKPAELLDFVLGFYLSLMPDVYDDFDKRVNDLESLQHIAGRYDSLEQFLADIALDPPEKDRVEKERRAPRQPHLVLSTIHSAKGLEWHTVFILFVAEGYLPSYQSLNNAEGVEEERRLLYVAMTRAKEHLFLLRPQVDRPARGGLSYSGYVYTRLSRFLAEGNILHRYVDVQSDCDDYAMP